MAVLSGLYLGQPQHLEQVNTKQPLRMSVVIIPPSYRFGNGSLEVVESLAGGPLGQAVLEQGLGTWVQAPSPHSPWRWDKGPGSSLCKEAERVGGPRATQGTGCCPVVSANSGYAGDAGSILVARRSLGGGNSNPVQYSCLGNPMDRGAWWAIVHRVTKSRTWVSTQTLLEMLAQPARERSSQMTKLFTPLTS